MSTKFWSLPSNSCSVIIPNRIVSGITWSRKAAEDYRIPYRIVLEIIFGNLGEGIPRGPNDQKNLISIEIFDLARKF